LQLGELFLDQFLVEEKLPFALVLERDFVALAIRLSAAVHPCTSLIPTNALAVLHRLDVLGTRTFRPAALGVRNLLTFSQIVELDALKAVGMEKQIFVRARLDETVAFVRQFLDGAFSHLHVLE
jgi:hypothetical protein